MGVLKAIKPKTTKLAIHLPIALAEQLTALQAKAKKHGFALDVNEAAVRGVSRMVNAASKELDDKLAKIEQTHGPAKPAPPAPPAKPEMDAKKPTGKTSKA